ncbi:MAG: 50S ribosomal protein L11 methyltransferase [Desulfobacterales bacterium]|nr:50S ribosomal protein L11 methyltransferase [Desulfobacterales bacterium]
MAWLEIRVVYEKGGDLPADELVAEAFDASGIDSVSITLPDEEPVEGWDPGGCNRDEEYVVTGYVEAGETNATLLENLKVRLNALEERAKISWKLETQEIPDTDWNESWKENFKPVHLTDRFVVKPTWESYEPAKDEKVIAIDPGMAFGTGTHPTTRLCVEMIEKYIQKGVSVLDVGTGSGILLVAAGLGGAAGGLGVDNDPVAVETAKENLTLNGVDHLFGVTCNNLIDATEKSYDLVVANILAEVVVTLLSDIHKVIHDDSLVILSGILVEKGPMVEEKLLEKGFRVVEKEIEESWMVYVAAKTC